MKNEQVFIRQLFIAFFAEPCKSSLKWIPHSICSFEGTEKSRFKDTHREKAL